MVTALALQLIQCVVNLPQPKSDQAATDVDEDPESSRHSLPASSSRRDGKDKDSKSSGGGKNKRRSGDPVCTLVHSHFIYFNGLSL